MESSETWQKVPRNHIKRRDTVQVTWKVGAFRFVATGMVEEKPHRLDETDHVRMKLAHGTSGFGWTDHTLSIVGPGETPLDLGEAGIQWTGWLALPDDAQFFR